MNQRAATGVGLLAIPLWASLATLTVLAKGIPALQLVAMSFTAATMIGVAYLLARPHLRHELRRLTFPAALVGISGLLFYHFFYFFALSIAPPLEANLVNYLWPLLIVLFSAFLPASSGKLHWYHLAGTFLALGGAVIAITKGQSLSLAADALGGYGLAAAAALTWATYSVVARLFAAVPSSAVTLYCAATALAAAAGSAVWEQPVWPLTTQQWTIAVALGCGPVGLAFYVWDYGCKRGDLRVLGAAAYFTPLLSSGLLVACGFADASPVLLLAVLAVAGGAVLAAKDMLFRQATPRGDNQGQRIVSRS